MLDDRHAGAGHDQGGGGADVEGAGMIAAGAAGIENVAAGMPADHVPAQHRAAAAISAAVSPFMRRPIRNAAASPASQRP